MSSLPTFPKFSVHSEESSAGPRWRKWIDKFENLLCALDIQNDSRRKALLLHYVGDEAYDIYLSFSDAMKGIGAVDTDGNTNEYNVLKKSFTTYFTPKENQAFEIYKFRQAKQIEGENIDSFHTRLRTLASTCNFHDTDLEVFTQIIHGCSSARVRRRAMMGNYTLEKTLDEARAIELSEARATEIEGFGSGNSVKFVARGRHNQQNSRGGSSGHGSRGGSSRGGSRGGSGRGRFSLLDNDNPKGNNRRNFGGARQSDRGGPGNRGPHRGQSCNPGGVSICRYCGGPFPHPKHTPCPAKGKVCHLCSKVGHFSRVCKSSNRKVRHVVRETDCLYEDESESSQYHEHVFTETETSPKEPNVTVAINNTQVKLLVDTGATVNIIDYNSYKIMKPCPSLNSQSPMIFAYGSKSPLPVAGNFLAKVTFNNKTVMTKFFVMKSGHSSQTNLLSGQTAQKLDIVHFALASSPASEVGMKYPTLFDGKVGKITDVKIKLHIDETVQPVTQKHRRIPFHIRKDVEAELEKLEKQDIIEKVESPTPWTSPIVVVPKKDGGVRICVDMREPNKAIKRIKHPMPTIDDLISDLNGSTVFSKLDLSSAYHQLELDEDSRYITTFTTHVGLRRYKRLLFGVNAASEIFQNAIADLLSDIPGVKNVSDDIIVHAENQADHDTSLHLTLKRLESRGVKLNPEKCQISMRELVFFGHVFSGEGIKPDPQKITAIVNTQTPQSVSEIRSFLGMTQYVARFIPNYSQMTEPLRLLTKKDQPWMWGKPEETAFNTLKQALTSADVVAYFDPTVQTEVLVDASPVGIGAILTQKGKVICYASRALTETEQRYSQTDREMLAVVFGIEHFHIYLYGADFTVFTDHKPLLGMIKSQKPATARIDRWRLRMMPYNFNLKYRPGKDENNPADFISRHPDIQPKRDNAGEAYVRYVTKNVIPKSMTLEEVQAETNKDPKMKKLVTAIHTGKWTKDLEDYVKIKDELSVACGVVLRGHRLVIPETLQQKVVAIAHASHQGIVKTKQLIREKVWFPGIDKQVEQSVKSCIPCLSSNPSPIQREPLSMTPLPPGPWTEVAVDFAGPFPSGDYLMVVVDEYSRYPEVEVISSLSARTVIPHLDTIFARHGIPQTVKTDNGPPFNGQEFKTFSKELSFCHRKVTPLWPEANGEAERFIQTLNKHVRTATAENVNWKTHLPQFLRLYRATPHSSTKISPFEALNNRKMRCGLPECPAPATCTEKPEIHSRMMDNDKASKSRMKEYADERRHTRPNSLTPGDCVLIKQRKTNKLSTPFNPRPLTIIHRKGSMITATRGSKRIVRNSSHFRRVPINTPLVPEEEEEEEEEIPSYPDCTTTHHGCPHIPAPQATPPARRTEPPSARPAATQKSPRTTSSGSDARFVPSSRPTRARKPPNYLNDYITK